MLTEVDISKVLNMTTGGVKTCECQVSGSRLQLVIDLGAKVSVIGESTYWTALSHLSLVPVGIQLWNYNGSFISLLGKVEVTVRYGTACVDAFLFCVTPSGTDIMGVDLFDALGYKHEPLVNPAIKPVMQALCAGYHLHSGKRCRLEKGGIIERIECLPGFLI